MNTSRLTMCVVIGLMVLPLGCDSKQEKAQKKMISLMDDYADALEGIKSNTDFIDSKPKLEKLGARMKDLMNEAKDLPAPTADEQKKLDKEFQDKSKKASDRISTQVERLTKLGVSPMQLMESMSMTPEMKP